MDRKTSFDSIPAWAQVAIEKAGTHTTTQISRNGQHLQISDGNAIFNGSSVAAEGEIVNPQDDGDETVKFSALPPWAQNKIKAAVPGSTIQITRAGDALQIATTGGACFNGKPVEMDK